LNEVLIQKTNTARHITCKHTTSSIASQHTSAIEHLFALYADSHEDLYSKDDCRILGKLFLERQQQTLHSYKPFLLPKEKKVLHENEGEFVPNLQFSHQS
jgi:hypothetical protein